MGYDAGEEMSKGPIVGEVISPEAFNGFPGIKKLMRRAAYSFLRAGGQGSLTLEHVEPASGEMLFSGAA